MVQLMITAFKSLMEIIHTNIVNFRQTISMSIIALKKRYSGTSFGTIWALVKPIVFIGVYWFGIQVGIRGGRRLDEAPFLLWLIAGIVPWFFIADVLSGSARCIVQNRHLVTKSVFPISTIPTFSNLHFFWVHCTILGLAILTFLFSGFGLSIYMLQLPYYMICLFLLMWVIAIFFSALVVVSRDFDHLLRSVTQMLFWLTPILWSLDNLKNSTVKFIIKLNPMSYIVSGYRDTFVYKTWFFHHYKWTAYFWAFMIIFSLLSAYLFKRLEKEFADIL